jgi:hypothetical protein
MTRSAPPSTWSKDEQNARSKACQRRTTRRWTARCAPQCGFADRPGVARRRLGDPRAPALAGSDGAHPKGSRGCLDGAARRVRDAGAARACGCTAPGPRDAGVERSLITTARLPAAIGNGEPVGIDGDPVGAVVVALGCARLSSRSLLYHPPRRQPTCTSHGHTASGGESMVMARVDLY